jgi:hypothetical protein
MRRDGLAETAGRNARPLMRGTRKTRKLGASRKKARAMSAGPLMLQCSTRNSRRPSCRRRRRACDDFRACDDCPVTETAARARAPEVPAVARGPEQPAAAQGPKQPAAARAPLVVAQEPAAGRAPPPPVAAQGPQRGPQQASARLPSWARPCAPSAWPSWPGPSWRLSWRPSLRPSSRRRASSCGPARLSWPSCPSLSLTSSSSLSSP